LESCFNPVTFNNEGNPVFYNLQVIPIQSSNAPQYGAKKDIVRGDASHYFPDVKTVNDRDEGDDFIFLRFGDVPEGSAALHRREEIWLDAIRYSKRTLNDKNLFDIKTDIAHEVGHELLSRHPEHRVRNPGANELLHNSLGGFMSYGHIITTKSGSQIMLMRPTEFVSEITTSKIIESVTPLPTLKIKLGYDRPR